MSDAVHRKGCKREGERDSLVMSDYRFCPACKRLVKPHQECSDTR